MPELAGPEDTDVEPRSSVTLGSGQVERWLFASHKSAGALRVGFRPGGASIVGVVAIGMRRHLGSIGVSAGQATSSPAAIPCGDNSNRHLWADLGHGYLDITIDHSQCGVLLSRHSGHWRRCYRRRPGSADSSGQQDNKRLDTLSNGRNPLHRDGHGAPIHADRDPQQDPPFVVAIALRLQYMVSQRLQVQGLKKLTGPLLEGKSPRTALTHRNMWRTRSRHESDPADATRGHRKRNLVPP